MFHVERELGGSAALPTELEPPAAAATVFGDRLDIARRYCAALATSGVERGLIGPREVPRLWDRHILNCAVVAELMPEGATVVDIGSGAGLPGIPLAIARPDLRITLVEPLLRRTVFLSEFIESAGLDITVVRGRAEQSGVMKEAGGADVVTSRAVAPLAKLAQWSLPLLRDHGRMLALKGVSATEELERDGEALTRAGAGNFEVLECGVGVLDTPTVVISAERLPRAERTPRRRTEKVGSRRAVGRPEGGVLRRSTERRRSSGK
ncbi:16S rRNA (guanine(527)-N(7))-methyltransferase RsmG [Nocardia amikacinitolerans]|uniref:16S rRNA (guanine(527)-N(7))-methyltransferase RsmG n=1 Tax=Nocardia amikacinitolerans TaxID=756689 RepID=UPI000BE33D16|nr:16S rRNA (guanine(527)-N(7))-methyltransferase RsmG [Nocardia amikacinitolerans]MCP2276719.1 16S rRNA (guanine527-N7)-methyltransferase [Nocardia amikacinitolerans]